MRCGSKPIAMIVLGAALALASTGCFAERSFPAGPTARVARSERQPALVRDSAPAAGEPTPTPREWAAHTHAALACRLPPSDPPALLTSDLVRGENEPTDVFAHFGRDPRVLRSIFHNLVGLQHTAQATSSMLAIDKAPPDWPGFTDIWVPIAAEVELSARFGLATRDGVPIDADCIVMLPGLLGDNGGQRTVDIAQFLRSAGYHVLALEMRGHGQTERRFPDVRYTFGIQETDDLMRVSDWLVEQPYVRRTGLLGYCWGATIALLAAWYDGVEADDPLIAAALGARGVARDRRRFEAGILACSPVLRYESIIQELHEPHSKFSDPVMAAVGETVRARMTRKGCDAPNGDLLRLINCELSNSALGFDGDAPTGRDFLRLLPASGLAERSKLTRVRTPVLIVHAANDPLCSAQDVADLLSQTSNPNVAALVLAGGGHCGFAPYARDYFYALLHDFFDPGAGPARLGSEPPAPVAQGGARPTTAARGGARSN